MDCLKGRSSQLITAVLVWPRIHSVHGALSVPEWWPDCHNRDRAWPLEEWNEVGCGYHDVLDGDGLLHFHLCQLLVLLGTHISANIFGCRRACCLHFRARGAPIRQKRRSSS